MYCKYRVPVGKSDVPLIQKPVLRTLAASAKTLACHSPPLLLCLGLPRREPWNPVQDYEFQSNSNTQHDGDTRAERKDMSTIILLKLEAKRERQNAKCTSVLRRYTSVVASTAFIGEYIINMMDGSDNCRRKAECRLAVRSSLGDHLALMLAFRAAFPEAFNFDDPVLLHQLSRPSFLAYCAPMKRIL